MVTQGLLGAAYRGTATTTTSRIVGITAIALPLHIYHISPDSLVVCCFTHGSWRRFKAMDVPDGRGCRRDVDGNNAESVADLHRKCLM